MKKVFLAATLCLLACRSLVAQDSGIKFIEDKPWQELLTMAAENNKLIFLDCYTTWCGPCKAMAKDVFPLPEVGDFMNANFINTKFDMEKGEGIELNKKYRKYIPGFPTYLLINAKGEVVHQVAGYNAADKFITKIKDGLQERTWIMYSHKYEAGQRDWEFVKTYLELLESAFQSDLIKQVVAETLPRINQAAVTSDSSAYRIFRKYWTDTESPLLANVLVSPGIYRKFRDPERDINEWGSRLYRRAVDGYARASLDSPAKYNDAKALKLIDDLRRVNIPARENQIALMLMSQAVVKKDGNKFLKLYKEAAQFGLLRYDQHMVGAWAKHFAGQTNDKALLKQYLACVQLRENDYFTTAGDVRNYAFILEKTGDKVKAAEYYAKADKIEADLKEKFKPMFEKK
ncbi:MAG: thioredoxin fold domain-containing protein [Chitinophagaceae bacterium]